MTFPIEVILPRRVRPQPIPPIHEGGDCGPCVLGGLWDQDVADVVAWLLQHKLDPPLSWGGMRQALWNAHAEGWLDRLLVDDLPRWGRPDLFCIWGESGWAQNLPWFRWIRMAVDAGYYGICSVDSARRGPFDAQGIHVDGDHWVMVVGTREREKPTAHGASIVQEILLSNSSTAMSPEEWVEVHEFLRRWGGYNALLARPA